MNIEDILPLNTQEECAEVIQAISKVFRFGINQVHPETGVSNKEMLETEIGQLSFMLSMLVNQWDLDPTAMEEAFNSKRDTYQDWYKYFPKDGAYAN
jgi:NTP pyrophosphatase (non-canonical NTP hydrolase)